MEIRSFNNLIDCFNHRRFVRLNGLITKETELAIQVTMDYGFIKWFPKSKTIYINSINAYFVEKWLLKDS